MSHTLSPSTQRPYGVVRVCQEWGLSRSTCYQQQTRAEALAERMALVQRAVRDGDMARDDAMSDHPWAS